jgi:phosphinothricin acetyltransferase
MECTIRNAETKDLPSIKEIMNDAVLNTTAIYDYHERSDTYLQHWFENLTRAGMPVLVCDVGGACVAYGCYNIFRPKDGYRFCVEHSIYVHKNERGKGFGKILLEKLIDVARRQNLHTMIAGIDAENVESIALHRKFGFTECGYLREVGYKFNR